MKKINIYEIDCPIAEGKQTLRFKEREQAQKVKDLLFKNYNYKNIEIKTKTWYTIQKHDMPLVLEYVNNYYKFDTMVQCQKLHDLYDDCMYNVHISSPYDNKFYCKTPNFNMLFENLLFEYEEDLHEYLRANQKVYNNKVNHILILNMENQFLTKEKFLEKYGNKLQINDLSNPFF